MRKILFSLGLFAFVFMLTPYMVRAACSPENIIIDGNYDDWQECEVLATDNKSESSNLQYWDNDAQSWTTTDPGYSTWTVDDAAMMDISRFKMLNNEQYVYFYMKNNWPMMAMQAPDGAYFGMHNPSMPEEFQDSGFQDYDFAPTSSPDFDHWMVWSFDKDLDGLYDYFFGAHLTMAAMSEEDSEDSEGGAGLAVYQDDGDGEFNADLDEKLSDIDPSDGKTSMDEGQDFESFEFEIRQNIEIFYEETGIKAGDTVKVRMETRSDIGDTTKGKKYTFAVGAPENVEVSDVASGQATVSWDKVSKAHHYQVSLAKKKTGKKISTTKATRAYLTLDNLTPGTSYRVKVRALTKNGAKGVWSDYVSFTTETGS